MHHHSIRAGRGARWLNHSIHVLEKNPRAIALVAGCFALLAAAPQLLGPLGGLLSLALVVLYPVLMGGMVWSVRAVDGGRDVGPRDLFTAFATRRALPLMALALPPVLFAFAMVLLLVWGLGAENITAVSQGLEADMSLVRRGALPWLLLLILFGGVAAFSATLFAVPLVMFDGVPGLQAIGLSLRAALANLGAVLVFLLCLVVALLLAGFALALLAMVLNLVAGALGPFAQQLVGLALGIVLNAGVVAVMACAHLLAWRDVFAPDGRPEGGHPPAPEEYTAEL